MCAFQWTMVNSSIPWWVFKHSNCPLKILTMDLKKYICLPVFYFSLLKCWAQTAPKTPQYFPISFLTHTHSVVFSPFATFPFFLIFIHSSTTGLSIFSLFCLVCFRCAPTTLPLERLFSFSSSHPLRLVFAHKKNTDFLSHTLVKARHQKRWCGWGLEGSALIVLEMYVADKQTIFSKDLINRSSTPSRTWQCWRSYQFEFNRQSICASEQHIFKRFMSGCLCTAPNASAFLIS